MAIMHLSHVALEFPNEYLGVAIVPTTMLVPGGQKTKGASDTLWYEWKMIHLQLISYDLPKKSMAMFNGYVRLPDGIHCNAWRKFWLKAVPQNYPWELQYHIVIELALLEEFQENGMDPMADLDINPKKRPVGTVEAYCQKQFHATEMKSHSQQQDVRLYILGTGVSGRVTDLLAAFFETSELIMC